MNEFEQRQQAIDVATLERDLQASRADVRELNAQLKEHKLLVEKIEREFGLINRIGRTSRPPGWLKRPPKSERAHHGTWWAMLSDLHLDEVVNPAEVMGINKYDRAIAEFRLKETFNGIIKVARDYHTGVKIDGLVMPFGGDMFSGIIHDELRRTNAAPILDSLDHWIGPMVEGIQLVADFFGRVHIPVVVGNHGRYDRKPIAKMRARENFDWYFAKAIARSINDLKVKNVTFDISDSPDVLTPSYGHMVMMTHGDQTNGGGGIGGIWPPIMRLDARKSQRQAAIDMPYDLLIMGHWHQLIFGPKFIINGSLKGYDEYAFTNNFGVEPAQQGMWLMTPEHGKTWTAPIFCTDRDKEGW